MRTQIYKISLQVILIKLALFTQLEKQPIEKTGEEKIRD